MLALTCLALYPECSLRLALGGALECLWVTRRTKVVTLASRGGVLIFETPHINLNLDKVQFLSQKQVLYILWVLLFMPLMYTALAHCLGQFHLQSKAARFAKLLQNLSYKVQCNKFSKSVNASGLFLILSLSGDIPVNPNPAVGVVNVRSIRNKV